jgi:hypothetical protein
MTATFGEAIEAAKRLTGFAPTKYAWRPFFGLVEVDRCMSDGGLVTDSQKSLKTHAGHRMVQPVYLKMSEIVLVALGFIKGTYIK